MPKSDEHLIETIRQSFRRSRKRKIWVAIFYVVAGLASVALTFFMISTVRKIGDGQGEVDRGLVLGFAAGMTLGFLMFNLIHQAVHATMEAFEFGGAVRIRKLLLKYHDEARRP